MKENSSKEQKRQGFGTAPVFFTAISTILGAILFLRFGYAAGMLGFLGVITIIVIGHLVTIPTALAISEIATNQRVEGGGEYFIISRSFGLNIGATIGIALYFSQAISVAFYVIAFTEAFESFFIWVKDTYDIILPRQVISIPVMLGLSFLILKRGANLGVKALYFVVGILLLSLVLFFTGETEYSQRVHTSLFSGSFRNADDFFIVFAICFPAFTGMTAGVGLSGDLRRPGRSIPLGTTLATISGMIIYVFIAWKLIISASPKDLVENQLIMSKIAIGGAFVIPLGLAASTLSSALGSVMVAPRTLQALGVDRSFPSKRLNSSVSRGKGETNEPFNATLITCVIALVFVAMGDVNAVAEIISMFFMVTYGSICLISFLNHFGADPSYRPTFRSKWYLSLLGFLLCVLLMFRINAFYALAAGVIMTLIYIAISYYHKERQGLEAIFSSAMFQLNRNLQVYLQKSKSKRKGQKWRPSAVCISKSSFDRAKAFMLLNWISFRYGFGTYIHLIEDYFSKASCEKAETVLETLLEKTQDIENHVYIDTMISPSYTSAIAQLIQLPGISGMENNMIIFEFNKDNPDNLTEIIENYTLVTAGRFDVCILGSTDREIKYKKGIHIWIRSYDYENSHLMILLSYIILGYPKWKRGKIKIFDVCKPDKVCETEEKMNELVLTGRLPISRKNIGIIKEEEGLDIKSLISERSGDAGLTMIGFRGEQLKHYREKLFSGYQSLGDVLFVNAHDQKEI